MLTRLKIISVLHWFFFDILYLLCFVIFFVIPCLLINGDGCGWFRTTVLLPSQFWVSWQTVFLQSILLQRPTCFLFYTDFALFIDAISAQQYFLSSSWQAINILFANDRFCVVQLFFLQKIIVPLTLFTQSFANFWLPLTRDIGVSRSTF